MKPFFLLTNDHKHIFAGTSRQYSRRQKSRVLQCISRRWPNSTIFRGGNTFVLFGVWLSTWIHRFIFTSQHQWAFIEFNIIWLRYVNSCRVPCVPLSVFQPFCLAYAWVMGRGLRKWYIKGHNSHGVSCIRNILVILLDHAIVGHCGHPGAVRVRPVHGAAV